MSILEKKKVEAAPRVGPDWPLSVEASRLKQDMEYALKHGLTDLTVANQKRREEDAARAKKAIEDRLAAIAAREKVQEEHVRKQLEDNPDRFIVSIRGKKVKPSKGLKFYCPDCGADFSGVITGYMLEMARAIWPLLNTPDAPDPFENPPMTSRTSLFRADNPKCRGCGHQVPYKIILLPW